MNNPTTPFNGVLNGVYWKLGLVLLAVFAIAVAKAYLEVLLKKKTEEKKNARKGKIDLSNMRRQTVLSPHEMKLWRPLCEVCRSLKLVVLAQVGFPGFIHVGTAFQKVATWRADFLICTEDMEPLAAIELDDSSHRFKERKDAERDKILRAAGIEAIRYERLPERAVLLQDLMRLKKRAAEPV
jgi:very-short-patch-repair endonuclease